MANYPFWSQVLRGTAVGSFFGFPTRLPGASISPGSPNIRELLWPFSSIWSNIIYELIQTNQVGSFFLQRLTDGVLIGILVTVLQEVATPASPVFFFDVGAEVIGSDSRLEHNWLDTNLAGTDPFVIARSTITVSRGDFGY